MRTLRAIVLLAMVGAAWSCSDVRVHDEQTPLTPTQMRARGDRLTADIHARVQTLLRRSPHDLFTRHLESTDAAVRADWLRCRIAIESDPEYVERSLGFYEKILAGLHGDAGRWDSYAAGRRALVLAYMSQVDHTLHAYHLRLPRDWEEGRAYPTIHYLHGHVPKAHPLWYVSLAFSPDKPQPNADQQELPPHFVLAPWGRGNGGYDGPAEADVWESIADATKRVTFDEDRQYLTGHSMGGFGTWRIASRSPDHWAAIAIYAGGHRDADPAIAGNLAHMPTLLWHGAKDEVVPLDSMRRMEKALVGVGNEPKIDIDPEAGHMVPRGAKTPHQHWLLEHTRQRPDEFAFIAESSRGRRAWGITLPRPRGDQPLPRFTCRIDGQTVHIDSENAQGLDVDLGPAGLGMTGEVTVIWNGKQAFSGAVPEEPIELGRGARYRRF